MPCAVCHGIRISIHAPRVGSDRGTRSRLRPRRYFNPRSPCGERRPARPSTSRTRLFQSTLPVWGATLMACRPALPPRFQSTLPVWGATRRACWASSSAEFQSTLPVWGATRGREGRSPGGGISIHAPRVGSDSTESSARCATGHFNPRSPCGERQLRQRVEQLGKNFNPRSPCGERHLSCKLKSGRKIFQSTLPVWGATSTPR